MPTKIDFLKAKLSAITDTLARTPPKEKQGPIPMILSKQFNAMLDDIKQQMPGTAEHLPEPITAKSSFRHMQLADVNFLALEIMVNQVLAILDISNSDH